MAPQRIRNCTEPLVVGQKGFAIHPWVAVENPCPLRNPILTSTVAHLHDRLRGWGLLAELHRRLVVLAQRRRRRSEGGGAVVVVVDVAAAAARGAVHVGAGRGGEGGGEDRQPGVLLLPLVVVLSVPVAA